MLWENSLHSTLKICEHLCVCSISIKMVGEQLSLYCLTLNVLHYLTPQLYCQMSGKNNFYLILSYLNLNFILCPGFCPSTQKGFSPKSPMTCYQLCVFSLVQLDLSTPCDAAELLSFCTPFFLDLFLILLSLWTISVVSLPHWFTFKCCLSTFFGR